MEHVSALWALSLSAVDDAIAPEILSVRASVLDEGAKEDPIYLRYRGRKRKEGSSVTREAQ